jgi:hypothetical protein
LSTILEAGTFRTSEYRKAIPEAVKLEVLVRQSLMCGCTTTRHEPCGHRFQAGDALASQIEFNHAPPLSVRAYSPRDRDFIPPQHDPNYIRAERKACHAIHTRGTAATTRGSVVGEGARAVSIRTSRKRHADKIAAKSGLVSAGVVSDGASEISAASSDASLAPLRSNAELRANNGDRRRGSSWTQGRKLEGRGFGGKPKRERRKRFEFTTSAEPAQRSTVEDGGGDAEI